MKKIVEAISKSILTMNFSDWKGEKVLSKLTEGVFVC